MSDLEVIDVEAELDNLPVVQEHAPVNLFRSDDPNEVVRRATETATALAAVLKQQALTSNISGKEYEIEAAYEDESDRDDRLYHATKENLLAPRSEWGPNEWRLAQIEGRLQPQEGKSDG